MATVERDPLKIYSNAMGNDMGERLETMRNNSLIQAQTMDGVLVVGDNDGITSDIDIEHHEIARLKDSLATADARKCTPISPSLKQPSDAVDRNAQPMRPDCDDCVVCDSGCVVTCPRHHNLDLSYAMSVSSSPDSANTPGSRSSLSTFSVLSTRCSGTPSIASELCVENNKDKEKGKGKESIAEIVTVPEQVHLPPIRRSGSITGSIDNEELPEVVTVERKRMTPPVALISPQYRENEEGGADGIPVTPIQRTTQTADNSYPENITRERDGSKVVAFMLPNEYAGELRYGNQGPVTATSLNSGGLGHVYTGDVTGRSGYKWLMLLYLTILNPLICFANALLTIGVLSILTITYPFKKLTSRFRNPPQQSALPTSITNTPTTNTTNNTTPLLWKSYLSRNVCNHLSSPLFFHIRIMYQTSRPPPLPEEWDSNRLIVVNLLAPVVSIVPCGMAAWGAALMWVYSVVLGEEGNEDEERTGIGWGRGRAGRAEYRGGEFYALRFVRKQWERWLWSALS